MDDVKIKAFEQKIIDFCNETPISNRVKHYILKDVAEKLLEASEHEIAVILSLKTSGQKQREEQISEQVSNEN